MDSPSDSILGLQFDINTPDFESLFSNSVAEDTDPLASTNVPPPAARSVQQAAGNCTFQIVHPQQQVDPAVINRSSNEAQQSMLGAKQSLPGSSQPEQTERKGRRWRSGSHQIREQLVQLEDQLEKITAQFNQLSTDNTTLRQRLQLLEGLLPLREQQAALVAAKSPALPSQTAPTPATAAGSSSIFSAAAVSNIAATLPNLLNSVMGSDMGLLASNGLASAYAALLSTPAGFDKTSAIEGRSTGTAASHVAVPAVACHNTGPDAAIAPAPQPANSTPGWTTNSSTMHHPGSLHTQLTVPTLGQLIQRALPLSCPSTASMSDVEFRQLFLDFQKSTGFLVASWEAYPSPHVLRQIEDKVLDLLKKTILGVGILDPDILFRNLYVNLETGERDCPGDQFWHSVARSIQFTPEQLNMIKLAMTSWEGGLGSLLTERHQLAHTLSHHVAQTQPSLHADTQMGNYSKMEEIASQMEGNLARERKMHLHLMDSLGLSVVKVTQCAKLGVASYPYVPDPIAVIKAFKQIAETELV